MKKINIYEEELYPVLMFKDKEEGEDWGWVVTDEEHKYLTKTEEEMFVIMKELEDALKEIKARGETE